MGVQNIGDNILKFRRKKGITQEALAEFVGVTKTSVSKWETGTTLPDIQILSELAAYFDVTIDELVGYTSILSKEQICFQYHRLADAFAHKAFSEVLDECNRMIKKYYSCYPFLQQMVVLLLNHMGLATNEEESNRVQALSLELCEHILTECRSVAICNNIIAIQAILNLQCGRAEQVIAMMEEETMNVNCVEDKGTLLTLAYLSVGEFDKAEKAAQIGMYRSLMDLIGYGLHLLATKKSDMKYGIKVIERMDQMIETFSLASLNPNVEAGYQYQVALYFGEQLLEKQDIDYSSEELEKIIFERLEKHIQSIKQLFQDDIKLHGDVFFYHLDSWFEELELGISGLRSARVIQKSVLQGLQHPAFVPLKDKDRLQHLLDTVSNLLSEK